MQHMATTSCFSSVLKFSFNPGGAGAWTKAEARSCGTAAMPPLFPQADPGLFGCGFGARGNRGQSRYSAGTRDGDGETRTASTRIKRVKKARPQLQSLIKDQQKSACCQQRKQAGETRQAAEGLGSLPLACTKADRGKK